MVEISPEPYSTIVNRKFIASRPSWRARAIEHLLASRRHNEDAEIAVDGAQLNGAGGGRPIRRIYIGALLQHKGKTAIGKSQDDRLKNGEVSRWRTSGYAELQFQALHPPYFPIVDRFA
jgi:hypothetical protein